MTVYCIEACIIRNCGVIVLIAMTLLGGCSTDCREQEYAPFALEIFVQQLKTPDHRLPSALRAMMMPIGTAFQTPDNRCFCPANDIDTGTGTPYLTLLRIDTGSSGAAERLRLLPSGENDLPTYQEYADSIHTRLAQWPIRMEFEDPPRYVERGTIERLINGRDFVYCVDTRLPVGSEEALHLPTHNFKVFSDHQIVIDSIAGRLRDFHAANTIDSSDRFRPRVAVLYNLDWRGIEAAYRDTAQIGVSSVEVGPMEEVIFRDISRPSKLMQGGSWIFDDGVRMPYAPEVVHGFRAGSHTVKLCNVDGKLCATTIVTVVNPPPSCDILPVIGYSRSRATTCDSITFTDLSAAVDTCDHYRSWFIDDIPVKTGSSLKHLFPRPGSYRLKLCLNGEEACDFRTVTVTAPLPFAKSFRLVLKETEITWSLPMHGLRYRVCLSHDSDRDHLEYESITSDTIFRLPPLLDVGRRYYIQITAMRCDTKITQGESLFSLVNVGGTKIIDPNCR